jgi:phage repressor protein C with HTH and peptisase S24 domain
MHDNRIRTWRLKKDWSLQQLADACGTSRAQIDKLERGERRLTVDWMVRLAKALSCLPAELLPDSAGVSSGEPVPVALTIPARLIPVRSAARGGTDQEMFLEDGPIDHRPCPSFVGHVRDAYAIYVVGDSMAPMYRPGQMLYVNPHRPLTPGRGVVITKRNKAVLIKELVRVTPTALVLREYQPVPRDFHLAQAEIAEAHSVVGAEEPGN